MRRYTQDDYAPNSPLSLLEVWRQRAEQLREWAGSSAEGAAHAYEKAAAELQTAWTDRADELLTLNEASGFSGYSADHLGRLVRDGTLLNHGRKNAPRVRRGDIPIKPATASRKGRAYNPAADAAEIISTRRAMVRQVINGTRRDSSD